MNTMMGISLAILAGMVLWALIRLTVKMPTWGLRAFWVAVVLLLIISTRMPEPYNLGMMAMAAGMAVFENLYHRHLVRSAARKAAKAAMQSSKTKRSKTPASNPPA